MLQGRESSWTPLWEDTEGGWGEGLGEYGEYESIYSFPVPCVPHLVPGLFSAPSSLSWVVQAQGILGEAYKEGAQQARSGVHLGHLP